MTSETARPDDPTNDSISPTDEQRVEAEIPTTLEAPAAEAEADANTTVTDEAETVVAAEAVTTVTEEAESTGEVIAEPELAAPDAESDVAVDASEPVTAEAVPPTNEPVAEAEPAPVDAAPVEVEASTEAPSDAAIVSEPEQAAEAAAAVGQSADASATPEPAKPVEPVEPPKPLDLETIALRTDALEKDLETTEHKVTLSNRLNALQEGLNNLETSEERAELDARLAAVQSAIDTQAHERIGQKEEIVIRSETLIESQEWKNTSEAFREMQELLRGVGAAGKELDDPIWERFRKARSGFHERRTAFFAERQKHWEESKVKKETLSVEAEALAEVEDFKDKSSRARAMMDEWKAAGFAGREAEDTLWPRFRGSLDKFYERRGEYYEQNRVRKDGLSVQAEEIADSTDWRTTAEALRRLMDEWKTLGSAGREHDDPLWERFRGAQQRFYDARSAAFAERESTHKENIARKEDLCAQAEEIAARSDMRGAIQDVIALQASWKTVGFIPRDKSDELWQRFKAACDGVFTHVDSEREDRQQSREVGFKDAMSRKREQYQRLNESIAHDQTNINRWRDTISSLGGGGGRADQIRNELEDRVIEVLMRVRDKQARAEELSVDLQDMESRPTQKQ